MSPLVDIGLSVVIVGAAIGYLAVVLRGFVADLRRGAKGGCAGSCACPARSRTRAMLARARAAVPNERRDDPPRSGA